MTVSESLDSMPLAQVLAKRAAAPEDGWSIRFLDSAGRSVGHWRAPDLAARTRAIAARLESVTKRGDPVLLVFQPGLDFLAAFMACLWTARLAVPINPPRRNRLLDRLVAVADDSGAQVALHADDLTGSVSFWRGDSQSLSTIDWLNVDTMADDPGSGPASVEPGDPAFIQYTSGSTSLPKGVVVTHRNLTDDMDRMADVWAIDGDTVMVTWMPAFHDLGLIFGLLQPLYSGCATIQMAPNTFLQRPGLWLEAITTYRGTHTAGTGLAYELCCRRIPEDQRQAYDLSSLKMAMIGAEPINPETMDRFAAAFEAQGFRYDIFAPAFGLAESTLAATGNPTGAVPLSVQLDGGALERDEVRQVPAEAPNSRRFVGCGRALRDVPIAIVDPTTTRRQPADRVGEVWIGGPTIANGYWGRERETVETFGVPMRDENSDIGYLRTGDLGTMIDGELYITGRLKDLIILNGANHYPQDIERVAQTAHSALRHDNGAAFSVFDDHRGELVVLVQELERTRRRDDPAPIFSAIAQAVWRELEIPMGAIVLVDPGSLLRTSSGKLQRSANRQAYLGGKLRVIAEWHVPIPAPDPVDKQPNNIHRRTAVELEAWIIAWLAKRLGLG
ncbi:MAG: fatty acyl-AMP ligase, partial [Pseudomonadota bacterium]